MADPWKEAAKRRLHGPGTASDKASDVLPQHDTEVEGFINEIPRAITPATHHQQLKDPHERMKHARQSIKRKIISTAPPTQALVSAASVPVSLPRVSHQVLHRVSSPGNTNILVPLYQVCEAATPNAAPVDPTIEKINRLVASGKRLKFKKY